MLMLMMAAALAPPVTYDQCLTRIDQGAFVKTQMLDCATKDMDRADAALNARYRAVMQRLSAQRRTQLRQEERRWITKRRSRCLAAARDPLPSHEINRILCLVRETDARTTYLGQIR